MVIGDNMTEGQVKALLLSEELWGFLKQSNQYDKKDWPKWTKIRGGEFYYKRDHILFGCFLCEKFFDPENNCVGCPLQWNGYNCSNVYHPFQLWKPQSIIKNIEASKKIHRILVNAIQKIGGNR